MRLFLFVLLCLLSYARTTDEIDENAYTVHRVVHDTHPAWPLDWKSVEESLKRTAEFSFSDMSGNNLRKRGPSFDAPTYIPWGTQQIEQGDLPHAHRFFFKQLSVNRAQFVLYPYSFTSNVNVSFTEGALLAMDTSELPDTDDEFFHYVSDTSTVNLRRAKALYDVGVGILQLEGEGGGAGPGNFMTIEAHAFCYPLYNYIGGKFASCWKSSDYEAYLTRFGPAAERTSVVYLNSADIGRGLLFKGAELRFGVLVLGNIYDGKEDEIVEVLGPQGKAQLLNFVNKGGLVFASGKGVLVAQKLGLIAPNTFDANKLLSADDQQGVVFGCNPNELPSPTDNSNDAFIKRTLCFGIPLDKQGYATDSITSAPLLVNSAQTDLKVVSWWEPSKCKLWSKDASTGLSTLLPSTSAKLPHVLYKQIGQGYVVAHLGSPTRRSVHFPWFYSAMLLSMSQPVMMHNDAIPVIPALEQITVTTSLVTRNLYNYALSDVALRIYVAKGVVLEQGVPSACTIVPSTQPPPHELLRTDMHIDCSPPSATLAAFASQRLTFKLFIDDVIITQAELGVTLLYPMLSYVDVSRSNMHVTVNHGAVTVDARMAALIRADVNADPLGHYPIYGRGAYTDNVLWAENKEETPGYNVTYTSIQPLVSPVLDGDNQAKLVELIQLDYLYYKSSVNGHANYTFPFRNLSPRDTDYLDMRVLGNRGSILCADWDTAIRMSKEKRGDAFASGTRVTDPSSSVPNSQYQTNVDNDETVVKQTYFADADNFYEHASQRLMSFLDLTKPSSFSNYNVSSSWSNYGGVVPPWMLNKAGNALKKTVSFAREDIYYYTTRANLPLPEGLDDYEAYITYDHYSEPSGYACTKSVPIPGRQGYYNVSLPLGLHASEYCNAMYYAKRAGAIRLSEASADGIEPELHARTQGKISMTHYLVRLADNGITGGDDVMFFTLDTTSSDPSWYYAPGEYLGGRYGVYRGVRIIYAFVTDFALSPVITRRGGRMSVILPSCLSFTTADPVASGYITWASDQISVTMTTYDVSTRKLTTYFKRGNMPNEQYGKDSQLQLNLEGLVSTCTSPTSFSAGLYVDELRFDVSASPTGEYVSTETYIARPAGTRTLSFTRQACLVLPALKKEYKLKRGPYSNESFVQPYEYLEPFVRYGIYMQELAARRTVWGSAETHHISDPGLTTKSSGFAWISNVGISSIPFREYLTTGSKQMIPSGPVTSSVSWQDMWGRTFSQPVRSLFVDVPPIPPPLRNFMMSTTYQLMDPQTGKRSKVWRSDLPAQVHVQMKLLNNYPKTFELTACQANLVKHYGPGPTRVFDPSTVIIPSTSATDQYINIGHTAAYGSCLSGGHVTLSGTVLTEEQKNLIDMATLCSTAKTWYAECEGLGALPTLTRKPENEPKNGTDYNYASSVQDHYPVGYIKPNMWDMTHYDYDDTPFDKAYKYHMDNLLPSLDSGIVRPHNIIAFPLFKGLGYKMAYDKSATSPRFPGYKGWWSDNLQNRDDTLLAGQATSPNVAVGNDDLTLLEHSGPDWISIHELQGVPTDRLNKALRNMYVCLFNRHRIRVDPEHSMNTWPNNVLQNNVVPIDPTLDKEDPRLLNFNCDLTKPQYTPEQVSQAVNNMVLTQTPRDWLYFAANLRGMAKETINVLYSLNPLSQVNKEAAVKVQDGGRFVYWNPALGPNAFLVVDSAVNVVQSERTDLAVSSEVFPSTTTTFQGLTFTLLTISDPAEISRTFDSGIYINHHGFGDAATSVYVGAYGGTSSVIQPGQSTYIKVQLDNNSGFDWCLYANAIDAEELESKAINANDLMYGFKHSIQRPRAYRFLNVTVRSRSTEEEDYYDTGFDNAELAKYISLVPSDHCIDTAPMLFDFENINVARIRDGFKGTYFYKLTVASDFPLSLKGKIHRLQVKLNYDYFDRLPGYNDPTKVGYHDYELTIPDIVFGVPYPDTHKLAGKVFTTSGFSWALQLRHVLASPWTLDSAMVVNKQDIGQLRLIASNEIGRINAMETFWSAKYNDGDHRHVQFVSQPGAFSYDLGLSLDPELPENDPSFEPVLVSSLDVQEPNTQYFPFPRSDGPDQAELFVLVRASAKQLPYGYSYVSRDTLLAYEERSHLNKTATVGFPLGVTAVGAWLELEYEGVYLTNGGVRYYDQKLHWDDKGVAVVTVTAINRGNDDAYNVEMSVLVAQNVDIEYASLGSPYTRSLVVKPTSKAAWQAIERLSDLRVLTEEEAAKYAPGRTAQLLTLHTFQNIPGGERLAATVRVLLGKHSTAQVQPQNKREDTPVNTYEFISGVLGSIDLTPVKNERRVLQSVDTPYVVPVATGSRTQVAVNLVKHTNFDDLWVKLNVKTDELPHNTAIKYVFYRSDIKGPESKDWQVTKEGPEDYLFERVAYGNMNNNLEVKYYVVVQSNLTGFVIGESEVVTYSNPPVWYAWTLGFLTCAAALGVVVYRKRSKFTGLFKKKPKPKTDNPWALDSVDSTLASVAPKEPKPAAKSKAKDPETEEDNPFRW